MPAAPAPRHYSVGEANASATLTEQAVRVIRDKYDGTAKGAKKLADRFGVTLSAVYQVLNGRTWAHVPGEPRIKPRDNTGRATAAKVSIAAVRDIRANCDGSPASCRQFADKLGVTAKNVRRIWSGRTFANVK